MSHLTCGADNVISTHMCINTREKQNYRNLLHDHPNISQACQQARLAGLKLIVLIPHWNGIRTYKDKFFYWDPNFSPHRYIYDHGTRHSDQIRNATYSFKQSLHLEQPTLGIHFRLERILRSADRLKVKQCLGQLKSLLKTIREENDIKSTILFRDYGNSGSSTCYRVHCARHAQEMNLDQEFRAQGVKVLTYSPESVARSEHGFIANVEQELLAQSDYIITVGYGSFQAGITKRFTRYNEDKGAWQNRIFKVCSQ